MMVNSNDAKTNQINFLLWNFDYESNQTCNTLIISNQTILKIDDGWETIPESIVIDFIFSMLLILPYFLFPHLIRSNKFDLKYGFLSWVHYFDRNFFNLQFLSSLNSRNKTCADTRRNSAPNLYPIESYFKHINQEDLLSLLPQHFEPCPRILNQNKEMIYSSTDKNIEELEPRILKKLEVEYQQSNSTETTKFKSIFSRILELNQYWRIFKDQIWTLKISDEQILREKGSDAYQYLLFQRYLILLLTLMSAIVILVIMPVNIHSNSKCTGFACTSMGNLPRGSWLCWFHANGSLVVLIITVYLMNCFAKELHLLNHFNNDDKKDYGHQKILLIRPSSSSHYLNRAFDKCDNKLFNLKQKVIESIREHFNKLYPMAKLIGIQLIFDIHHLEDLELAYRQATEALQYLQETSLQDISIRPSAYSKLCCCPESLVLAREFYHREQMDFRKQINFELKHLIQQPIRALFIEFETKQMATNVYKSIKKQRIKPSKSTAIWDQIETNLIEFIEDRVNFAASPDDIHWKNLSMNSRRKWLWKCLCSLILFIIFFFLSTPTYVFKLLDIYALKHLHDQEIIRPISILIDYLSPLLMVILVSMMPVIVTKVLQMIPYQTISDLNHAIMINLYSFMVITIIILPSVGFLTTNAFLDSINGLNTTISSRMHAKQSSLSFRWECLFPVDNGAFFVIYILHATILGNLMELLRLCDLVLYVYYYWISLRSKAEYQAARRAVLQEFPLGVFYSQFLLIFTMTAIFSFASPLIVPCGLVYMFTKHLVDRYNICYVYNSTKINSRIHSTAIVFVYVSMILMMLQLLSVMLIKTDYSLVSKYVLIIFICSLVLSCIQCFCSGIFSWITCRQKNSSSIRGDRCHSHEDEKICICSYTLPVLLNLLQDEFFGSNNFQDVKKQNFE